MAPSASAGSKVVKDAETGRLRPARAGELPDAPAGRPTQIIDSPDGGAIAVVGDDLMSDSIAVKNADGSISGGARRRCADELGGEVVMLRRLPLLIAAILTALATPATADPRARVVLLNFDAGTGVGLDDPTPVAPIGGNTGTTLGQQRQIALSHAARSGRATCGASSRSR